MSDTPTCQRGHPIPEVGRCPLCHSLAQSDTNALIQMAASKLGISRKEYREVYGCRRADAERILNIPATPNEGEQQ